MENEKRCAVFYTDGGCHLNRRIGGCGVHGYIYVEKEPKKGAALPGYVLTPKGYKVKDPKDPPRGYVTVENYVDVIATQETGATNNTAEAQAMLSALEMAGVANVEAVHIVADSEYALSMFRRLDELSEKQWVKSDGQIIKNVDLWKAIYHVKKTLIGREIEITCDWTKGHAGEPGNNRADLLATIGLAYAGNKKPAPEPIYSPYDGYWKATDEYNKLLGTHYTVKVTGVHHKDAVKDEDYDRRFYLYSDTSKLPKIKTFGTAHPQAAYAIVDVKDPHPLLETVEEIQESVTRKVMIQGPDGPYEISDGSLVMIRPQDVYRRETAELLKTFGEAATIEKNGSLLSVGDKKITESFQHTRNAMMGLDMFESLEKVFNRYTKGDVDDTFIVRDITEELFDVTVTPAKGTKPEKTTYKLKSFPETDDKFVRIKIEQDRFKRNAVLVYGMDLPSTNALKAAGRGTPVVRLVLQKESADMWCYYVAVESEEGRGIWHNPFSSVLLPLPK